MVTHTRERGNGFAFLVSSVVVGSCLATENYRVHDAFNQALLINVNTRQDPASHQTGLAYRNLSSPASMAASLYPVATETPCSTIGRIHCAKMTGFESWSLRLLN